MQKLQSALLGFLWRWFAFPSVYRELLEKVRAGKYGKKRQQIALSDKYIAVDAETYVYVCNECGYWKTQNGLSLYAPNDKTAIAKKVCGNWSVGDLLAKKSYIGKTVEELGEVPYVTESDLEEDYHLVNEYIHRCSKCRGVMHKATEDEIKHLQCPICGEKCNEGQPWILWD